MANLNPTQFQQLPMFMSAREITNQFAPYDYDREATVLDGNYEALEFESDDELWDRKTEEAWNQGLRHEMANDNFRVRKPIHLAHDEDPRDEREGDIPAYPQIAGGHHRIAVLNEEAPDQLQPVLHHETLAEAQWEGGMRKSWYDPPPENIAYPYS